MKLAEALIERADRQRRLEELQSRITRNAIHQEGDKPAEDPKTLLKDFEQAATDLENLIIRINLTNNQAKLGDGTPMVAALARRDVLKKRHGVYKALASEATPSSNRYSRSELKYISAVDVKKIQKISDEIAKEHRELDALVQQANWQHDLID